MVFYYAGHGLQVDQANFLVPPDAELASVGDVYERSVALSDVMATLGRAGGLKIILLDACQDNPLPPDAGFQPPAGLARVATDANVLVSYAAQPGSAPMTAWVATAPSPRALLAQMSRDGAEILDVLAGVNGDVSAATGGLQVPYVQFSIKPPFYFVPGKAEEESPELRLWRVTAVERDPELVRIYLDRYPSGGHAAEARALLAELDKAGGAQAANGAASADIADTLWRLGRETRNASLVELYVARYPEGSSVAEARELLATLAPADAAPIRRAPAASGWPPTQGTPPPTWTAFPSTISRPTRRRRSRRVARRDRRALRRRPLQIPAGTGARGFGPVGSGSAPVSGGGGGRRHPRDGDARPPDGKRAGGAAQSVRCARDVREGGRARSADGAINLAVALTNGKGRNRDLKRAVDLLKSASDAGSGMATFNLGQIYDSGLAGTNAEALALFRKAADQGYAPAHLAAGIILDEGRGVPADPAAAAEELLTGLQRDSGETLGRLADQAADFSPDTIRALQRRLTAAGYYRAEVDGRGGQRFRDALRQWRMLGGPPNS